MVHIIQSGVYGSHFCPASNPDLARFESSGKVLEGLRVPTVGICETSSQQDFSGLIRKLKVSIGSPGDIQGVSRLPYRDSELES